MSDLTEQQWARDLASGWLERARAHRAGSSLPDPLTVEEATADSRGLFGALLKRSFDGIVVNERESQWILEVSDSFCRLTGYSREELIGRTSVEGGLVVDEGRRAGAVGRLNSGLEGLYDAHLRRKDGELRAVEFSHQLMPGNELELTIVRDVTERVRREEELRHLAATDDLTGVLNRRRFHDELEYPRLDGDEFAGLLTRSTPGGIERVVDDFKAGVERKEAGGAIDGVAIAASIGIATSQEGDDAESMLRKADRAMYAQKNS